MSHKSRVITARLTALRKDARAVLLLTDFLKHSYGHESVLYTLRVHELAPSDPNLAAKLGTIADEFLRDDAPMRLALPHNVRTAPLSADELKRDAFLHLADTLLQDDVYEALYRFFNSAVYREHEQKEASSNNSGSSSTNQTTAFVSASSSSSTSSPALPKAKSGFRRWLSPSKSAPSSPSAGGAAMTGSAASVAGAFATGAGSSPSSPASPSVVSGRRAVLLEDAAYSLADTGKGSSSSSSRAPRSLPIGLSFMSATKLHSNAADDESSSSSTSEIEFELDDEGLKVLIRTQRRARTAMRIRRWRRAARVLATHFSAATRKARNAAVVTLVENEAAYAVQLRLLVDLFAKPLASGKCGVTPVEYRVLFGPLVSLAKTHAMLVSKLKKRLSEFPRKNKIAEIFAALKDDVFEAHLNYDLICANAAVDVSDLGPIKGGGGEHDIDPDGDHDDSSDLSTVDAAAANGPMTRSAVMEQCMQRPEFIDHLQRCYEDERCNADALTMLDAPRGRLQFHIDQFQTLLDFTPRDHVDFDDIASLMRRLARFVPTPSWQGEVDARQLDKLQRRVSGFDVKGDGTRALVLDATLHWRDTELPSLMPGSLESGKVARAHVGVFHFFLFTDTLIRTRKLDDDNYKFKTSHPLNRLAVECVEAVCADLEDYTKVRWPLRLTDSSRSYSLGFDTREEREQWRRALLLLGAKNALLLGTRGTLTRDPSIPSIATETKKATLRAARNSASMNPAAAAFDRSTMRGSGRWTSQQSAPVPKEALSKTPCPYPRLPFPKLLTLAQAADSGNDVTGYGADGLVLRRNPLYGRELPWARVKLPTTKPIIADSFLLARESSKKAAKSGGGGASNPPSASNSAPNSAPQTPTARETSSARGDSAFFNFVKTEIANDMAGEEQAAAMHAAKRVLMREAMRGYDRRVAEADGVAKRDQYASDIVRVLSAVGASDPTRIAHFDAEFYRVLVEDIRVGALQHADVEGNQVINDVLASPRRNPNANVTAVLVQRVRNSMLSDLKLAAREMPIRDTPLRERTDVWDELLTHKSGTGAATAASQLDEWEVEILTPRTRERHHRRHRDRGGNASPRSPRSVNRDRTISPRGRSATIAEGSPTKHRTRSRSASVTRRHGPSLSPRRKLQYGSATTDEVAVVAEPWAVAAASFMEHEDDEAQLKDFQSCRLAILEKRRVLLATV